MKQIRKPTFTVFTGTWNRAGYLRRVYDCLLAQTFQDFEWLIVDDGSTDDTRERVQGMIAEGRLHIRYFRKENGGVHTAHNLAVEHAKGEFFLRCDSDDLFVPEAMATLLDAWRGIPDAQRSVFSGVSCLCKDERGEVVGEPYPADPWDSDYKTLVNLRGEKWGFHTIEILKSFMFPVFAGERFCPESIVWGRIHERYKTRCINTCLRIYTSHQGQISHTISRLRYRCPNGYRLFYQESLRRSQSIKQAIKSTVNYIRVSLSLNQPFQNIIEDSPRKLLTLLILPLGGGLYLLDRAYGFTDKISR